MDVKEENNSSNTQNEQDKKWEKLMLCLKKGNEEAQRKALELSIKRIIKICQENANKDEFTFPDKKFSDILLRLLSKKKNNSNLISHFHQLTDSVDFVFHFWRCLPKVMLKEPQTSVYHLNLLDLIDKKALPKNYTDPECGDLLCEKEEFKWNYEIVKKKLNRIWDRTRHWNFSQNVQKKHLIVMVERIMPHIQKPILWTDYLMNSLNQQGSIAFLALQGIYKLIVNYNIEVPQIYVKLYNMLQPEVFHSRFKQRLFYLADLFLSSSHLPESIVASFIKRCSRLCLIAPPEDVCIMLVFVNDLMIRHPGLKKLIDYPSKDEDLTCKGRDPFLENENDPMETKAIESSLWEIRTLKQHILPPVSQAAKFIDQNLSYRESGIANKLEDTGSDIFNREIKRSYQNVALNFERPCLMKFQKGERINELWDLKLT